MRAYTSGNQASPEGKDALQQIGEAVRPFTSPILVFPSVGNQVLTGGSSGFLRTCSRRLLVTNHHVYKEMSCPGRRVFLCGKGEWFSITNWDLVDQSQSVDLAVLAVPDDFNEGTLGKNFCVLPSSRLRISRGDTVFFVGYPALHRLRCGDELTISITPFCDTVSSVSDLQFVVADETQGRKEVRYSAGLETFGSTGGMSGSPIFTNEGKRIVPVGVLSQGDETVHASFFATHIDFIQEDGSIDHLRIPV